MSGQVNWAGPLPGSCPTWYLTHEHVGRDPTGDLQKLQVTPLTVPLFLEGRSLYAAETAIKTADRIVTPAPKAAGLDQVASTDPLC